MSLLTFLPYKPHYDNNLLKFGTRIDNCPKVSRNCRYKSRTAITTAVNELAEIRNLTFDEIVLADWRSENRDDDGNHERSDETDFAVELDCQLK